MAHEVSFSIWGERGVIDLLMWHPGRRALLIIELKTEIVDTGELLGTMDRRVRLARKIAEERGWDPLTVSSWIVLAPLAHQRSPHRRASIGASIRVPGRRSPHAAVASRPDREHRRAVAVDRAGKGRDRADSTGSSQEGGGVAGWPSRITAWARRSPSVRTTRRAPGPIRPCRGRRTGCRSRSTAGSGRGCCSSTAGSYTRSACPRRPRT